MGFLGEDGQIAYYEDACEKSKDEIKKWFPKGGYEFKQVQAPPAGGFQIRVNGVLCFDKLVLGMGFLKGCKEEFSVIVKDAIKAVHDGKKPVGCQDQYEEELHKKEEEEKKKQEEEERIQKEAERKQ